MSAGLYSLELVLVALVCGLLPSLRQSAAISPSLKQHEHRRAWLSLRGALVGAGQLPSRDPALAGSFRAQPAPRTCDGSGFDVQNYCVVLGALVPTHTTIPGR